MSTLSLVRRDGNETHVVPANTSPSSRLKTLNARSLVENTPASAVRRGIRRVYPMRTAGNVSARFTVYKVRGYERRTIAREPVGPPQRGTGLLRYLNNISMGNSRTRDNGERARSCKGP